MKSRIYVDTSVIGGYFDVEFSRLTKILFEKIINREYYVFLSEINETELLLAPIFIQKLVPLFPDDCLTYLKLNYEVKNLAQTYIIEKVLGKASKNDAFHIAFCSVYKIDYLVSWNFKHIVNFDKIIKFNAINSKLGYPSINICSPLKFLENEN